LVSTVCHKKMIFLNFSVGRHKNCGYIKARLRDNNQILCDPR